MYTCPLIVEVIIAIFPDSLNDMWPHIMNDWKFTCFLHAVIFVSFEQYQAKIPALLPWLMQFLDSSLNTIFIPLFICHSCLFLVHFNFIFFLYVNPILFYQFLTVLSHWHFFWPICFSFILMYIYIFYFQCICFKFSILTLRCLLCSVFSFFNHPISFIFAPNFKHNWLGIILSFVILHY